MQKRIKKQQKANNFTPVFSKSVEKSRKIAKNKRFPILGNFALSPLRQTLYAIFPSQSQKPGVQTRRHYPDYQPKNKPLSQECHHLTPIFSSKQPLLILPASKAALILSASKAAHF